MEALHDFLSSEFNRVSIDFSNRSWHISANIPSNAGWYYIKTNTPLDILTSQALQSRQYIKKRSGVIANVKNYDFQARCARYEKALSEYWNTTLVYSGLASNLQSRAREHTFTDPGTGGLALEKYPKLHEFQWEFFYKTLENFMPSCTNQQVLLLLGEQIWRSRNGWPILCAE